MRSDTVHALVNRYSMPDFAQFIQMEAKGIKNFLLFGSSMNISYKKQQTLIFCCAESLPLCSICLIVLTNE